MSYSAVSRKFPVTSLANMLAGYSRQMVADIIARVITTERMLVLKQKPLDPMEFVAAIINYPKMEADELRNQYYNWYSKCVPLGIKKKGGRGAITGLKQSIM